MAAGRKYQRYLVNTLRILAEISDGFSGREIKNAILNGMIRAAKTKEYVDFKDMKLSFEAAVANKNNSEKKKNDSFKERIRKKLRKAFGKKYKIRKSRCIFVQKKAYRTVKAL